MRNTELCYCYVCDTVAPCKSWPSSSNNALLSHCNAYDSNGVRKRERILRKPVSAVLKHEYTTVMLEAILQKPCCEWDRTAKGQKILCKIICNFLSGFHKRNKKKRRSKGRLSGKKVVLM